MRTKIVLLSALMLSTPAFAGVPGLEGATKKLATDAAKSAAPSEAVEGVKTTGESLKKANTLKESTEKAPATLQEQTQDAAKQKLKDAAPEEAKEAVKTGEKAVKQTKKLKGAVEKPSTAVDEATGAAKKKATEEATDKALDLMR